MRQVVFLLLIGMPLVVLNINYSFVGALAIGWMVVDIAELTR